MDLKLPEKRVFIGPATLWKRMLAFILDLIILDFFVVAAFRGVMTRVAGDTTGFMATVRKLGENSLQLQAITMMFMIIVMLAMTYFVLLQYATGQTLGCMLLSIHIVFAQGENEFERPRFWQCLVRNLFMIPTLTFVLLWAAEPVYFFAARKGQRLTEWMSRTKVVEQYEI
jgi:uncharacterized RDD family membrane protein YckC